MIVKINDDWVFVFVCDVFDIEVDVVCVLCDQFDGGFVQVVVLLFGCCGCVVVFGIGKLGYIVCKIVVMLVSIGMLVFFVYFVEVSYGDFGMVIFDDVFIGIFYFGELEEFVVILLFVKWIGVKLIVIMGCVGLSFGMFVDVNLNVVVLKEVCLLNFVFIVSMIVVFVFGDVFVVVVFDVCGFGLEDFVCLYLGGVFGWCLFIYVCDVMCLGDDVLFVGLNVMLLDVLFQIIVKCFGMMVVVDVDGKVVGIFMDGDLCCVFVCDGDFCMLLIIEVMMCDLCMIVLDYLVVEVVELMECYWINQMLVVDVDGVLIGVLNMYDLFLKKVI